MRLSRRESRLSSNDTGKGIANESSPVKGRTCLYGSVINHHGADISLLQSSVENEWSLGAPAPAALSHGR